MASMVSIPQSPSSMVDITQAQRTPMNPSNVLSSHSLTMTPVNRSAAQWPHVDNGCRPGTGTHEGGPSSHGRAEHATASTSTEVDMS